MIRFLNQAMGVALLAVAFVTFSNVQAQALTPNQTIAPPSASVLGKGPLQPVTNFGWTELEDIECGSEVDFSITDIGQSVKDLLGGLITNYIFCPVIKITYEGVGLVINSIIGPMLKVDPIWAGTGPSASGAPLYAAWGAFRDLANIGLAFAALLLIFSQATSYGLSAYGVRKLLPKIVIAALLINLSFILCAVLIDVFNILGNSLGATLQDTIGRAASTSTADIVILGSSGVTGVLQGISALPGIAMMVVALPVLLLLGWLAVIFALARQLLIAFLIVVGPVAIAAWLFPNTERYFNKWWSTFIKLLVIYPVV